MAANKFHIFRVRSIHRIQAKIKRKKNEQIKKEQQAGQGEQAGQCDKLSKTVGSSSTAHGTSPHGHLQEKGDN